MPELRERNGDDGSGSPEGAETWGKRDEWVEGLCMNNLLDCVPGSLLRVRQTTLAQTWGLASSCGQIGVGKLVGTIRFRFNNKQGVG